MLLLHDKAHCIKYSGGVCHAVIGAMCGICRVLVGVN